MTSPPPCAAARRIAAAAALALAGAGLTVAGTSYAATSTTLYASPSGSGTTCSQSAPCSLTAAQGAVRSYLAANPGADVAVQLADGVYRLTGTWALGAADSGSAGHPVVWQAAAGAHPVISGATRVTGWTQVGTTAVWSAPVPAGSNSRQLYIDGKEVPVAQSTPTALGMTAAWTGSSSGYSISGDATAQSWFGGLTAAQVANVEFDYPGGNGAWTDSRCRVASYSASAKTLTMTQPCWGDLTSRASFSHASGGLPSMGTSTKPSSVLDAQKLIGAGQWYLDAAGNTLYYQPVSGQSMASADVELPKLESLVQVAGTLANPVHDVTFSGLQFSYATWNAPSTSAGFPEVQSNLTMTTGTNQGMCNFSTPAGSCPWGSLTQPLANVAVSGARNVSLRNDKFSELGGAGLSVMYGSSNTLVDGNEFTDIASTSMVLGCTYDPLPTDSSEAAGIKSHCAPSSPDVSGDSIGANEILTNTTVSNNVVHHTGTDYTGASGVTLLFSQGTTIENNDIYDVPYTGITAGVIQGHVDQAGDSQNSTNINKNNAIKGNVFHDYLTTRSDGGAIYVEGHQAQYVYKSDGTTIDPVATLAQGLQVTGNVAYNGHNTNFTYYDDAGSEWINWQGNAAFNGAGGNAQGGCSPTGHFWITGNYFHAGTQSYPCAAPLDSNASGNTVISDTPGPGDVPNGLLSAAGIASSTPGAVAARTPQIYYVSPTASATQVLVAGEGFTASMPVYVGATLVNGVTQLSGGFLLVPIPAGTQPGLIGVGAPVASYRVNDSDPSITYTNWSYAGGRGLGDYQNDIHYATANGATASYPFTGTGIDVYGEQYTDQGTIGISVDGGTQVVVNTVPSDGTRHSNVMLYSATGLSNGSHTVVVTKLSGTYSTFDGFTVHLGSASTTTRLNDTASSISYTNWSYSSGRGLGDYQDDVHYATANGASATLTFTGTGVQVYGEQYTDQGTIGISVDGGTQVVVNTVPSDGTRHSNVVVDSVSGLAAGSHTIVVTKLSGTYSTLDGFGVTS